MKKKPTLKTLRNKTDKLLSPIVKLQDPVCLLCSKPTQVGHHFIKKSTSSRLRYELSNIINLCNPCHCALHHNESYYSSKIIAIKGLEWFEELEKIKNDYNKVDRYFYEENYTKLKEQLDDLSDM